MTIRKKANRNFHYHTTWIGVILVFTVVLASFYFLDLDRKWYNRCIETNINVYFSDTLTLLDNRDLPLMLKTPDSVIRINSFEINRYCIKLKPGNNLFTLETANKRILKRDTLYFDGAKNIHINIREDYKGLIVSFFEFFPL
jgi:hypothetical protein